MPTIITVQHSGNKSARTDAKINPNTRPSQQVWKRKCVINGKFTASPCRLNDWGCFCFSDCPMLSWCTDIPLPDKGTVQKVVVLPSNGSLDEDLILEELEVFKVWVFTRHQSISRADCRSRAGSATKHLLELFVILREGRFLMGKKDAWGEEKVASWGFSWAPLSRLNSSK